MTTERTKSPMQMAGEVSRVAELANVATRSWAAHFRTEDARPPSLGGPIQISVQHGVKYFLNREAALLDLEIEFHLVGHDKLDSGVGDKERMRVAVDLVLRYSFAEGLPELSEEHFKHFAELNGVMNAWPYVREMVQSSTSRMGLPPFVLPLLKASRLKAPQEPKLPEG